MSNDQATTTRSKATKATPASTAGETHSALVQMAKDNLDHARAGTIDQAESVKHIPSHHYTDEKRFELELQKVFRRMPLFMALSTELANPGDYKTMTVAGVPVLISRDKNGNANAYLNSCSHRGAQIMTEPKGNARQFSCPYHAWTYNHSGELIAIFNESDYGSIDKSCHSLVQLPSHESAGLIWVTLDPDSPLPISEFLSGYDSMLASFGFDTWQLFDSRTLKGPNWKAAYDGYLDLYHLPILHKDTFGADMHNRALYTPWGPHQRVSSPDSSLEKYADLPDEQWDSADLMKGVWTIFPHVSIASFDGGGRGVMISQLFPGETVGESYTTQMYVMENLPTTPEVEKAAHEQFAFLEHVVRDEDYATGIRQQTALASGLRGDIMFGRNEAGGQRFHDWLDELLKTPDEDLLKLFERRRSEDQKFNPYVPQVSAG